MLDCSPVLAMVAEGPESTPTSAIQRTNVSVAAEQRGKQWHRRREDEPGAQPGACGVSVATQHQGAETWWRRGGVEPSQEGWNVSRKVMDRKEFW